MSVSVALYGRPLIWTQWPVVLWKEEPPSPYRPSKWPQRLANLSDLQEKNFLLVFILLSLHKGMYKGCRILPKMTVITGTHLRHILRGAFCHRILLGPSCCSPCHQMDGRKGQVSACPWASSVVRNGSALQHGYSWRSQCTWEHTYAAVSTLGNGINETESV